MPPKYWKPTKRINVEVKGGDADGLFLATDDPDSAIADTALMVYQLTEGGTKGRAFAGMSIANNLRLRKGESLAPFQRGMQAHYYTVIEQIDEPNEMLIQLQHRGGDLPPELTQRTRDEDLHDSE
jgi:hypothetical protein